MITSYSFLCFPVVLTALLLVSSVETIAPNSFSVSAEASLKCYEVWDGPSSTNDVSDCFTDGERLKSEWKVFIIPVIALIFVISLITWIACLYCFCCPVCCCGENLSRMKSRIKRRKACLSGLTALPVAICVAIIILTAFFVCFSEAYGLVYSFNHRAMGYLKDVETRVQEYLSDYSTEPPTPPTLDFSAFDKVFDKADNISSDVERHLNDVFLPGTVSFVGLGVLILAFVIGAMIVSQIFCCVWWAVCCSCFNYIIAIVFALLFLGSTVLTYFVRIFCGETVLQYERKPGVFQWYVVPWVQKEFDFDSLQSTIQSSDENAAQNACSGVLSVCEEESGTTTTKPFVCPEDLTSSTDCTSIQQVSTFISETYLKPSLLDTDCPAPEGSTTWECTVEECVTACVSDSVQKAAIALITLSDVASNASTALSLVKPLLEANYLVDLALSAFESKETSPFAVYSHGEVKRCMNFYISSIALCVAFLVGSLVLLIALCVSSCSFQSYPCCTRDLPSLSAREKQLPSKKVVLGIPVEKVDKGSEPIFDEVDSRRISCENRGRSAVLWIPPSKPVFSNSEYEQSDALDEEEMVNRAREKGNWRLPLNPLEAN